MSDRPSARLSQRLPKMRGFLLNLEVKRDSGETLSENERNLLLAARLLVDGLERALQAATSFERLGEEAGNPNSALYCPAVAVGAKGIGLGIIDAIDGVTSNVVVLTREQAA